MEEFKYDGQREAYVATLKDNDVAHRIVLSREFLDEEVGNAATEQERMAWINANIANIFGAYTARVNGGFVKAPWGRILVEEMS